MIKRIKAWNDRRKWNTMRHLIYVQFDCMIRFGSNPYLAVRMKDELLKRHYAKKPK